jgi:hypothetical protein
VRAHAQHTTPKIDTKARLQGKAKRRDRRRTLLGTQHFQTPKLSAISSNHVGMLSLWKSNLLGCVHQINPSKIE